MSKEVFKKSELKSLFIVFQVLTALNILCIFHLSGLSGIISSVKVLWVSLSLFTEIVYVKDLTASPDRSIDRAAKSYFWKISAAEIKVMIFSR